MREYAIASANVSNPLEVSGGHLKGINNNPILYTTCVLVMDGQGRPTDTRVSSERHRRSPQPEPFGLKTKTISTPTGKRRGSAPAAKRKALGAVDIRSIALARRAEASRIKNQQSEAYAKRAAKHDGLWDPSTQPERAGGSAPRLAPLPVRSPLLPHLYLTPSCTVFVFSNDSLLMTIQRKTEKEMSRKRSTPSLPSKKKIYVCADNMCSQSFFLSSPSLRVQHASPHRTAPHRTAPHCYFPHHARARERLRLTWAG